MLTEIGPVEIEVARDRDGEFRAGDRAQAHTAPTEPAAKARLDELAGAWGGKYPAIPRLWQAAWAQFVPFLDYHPEIRRIIHSTNAIESLNARHRRAVRARGHFPTEQATLKSVYLVTRSPDPTGRDRPRWPTRWKPAPNAFAITFDGRLNPTSQPNQP